MIQAETKSWKSIFLDPCDVLLFRDGRPFDATNRVLSGLPAPQTVAGAIRTALLNESGFSFSKLRGYQGHIVDRLRDAGAAPDILDAQFRGPWFARRVGPVAASERLMPCPKNLRTLKKDERLWMVARPQDPSTVPIDGWTHDDGLWPLKYADDPEPKFEPVYLTTSGFAKYLNAIATPSLASFGLKEDEDFVKRANVYGMDHRIGIGIDSTSLTTMDGELYGVGLLAMRPGFGIVMNVELTESRAASLDGLAIPIGGEGKLVRVSVVESSVVERHAEPKVTTNSGNTFVYLATPTFLSAGRTANRPLPPTSCGKLRAAASERPIAVSGWDVSKGGPRPNRFAIPAGAVYFFDGTANGDLMEDSSDRGERLQEGWGDTILGTWSR